MSERRKKANQCPQPPFMIPLWAHNPPTEEQLHMERSWSVMRGTVNLGEVHADDAENALRKAKKKYLVFNPDHVERMFR